ncbi:MAG: dTDP-4-dehydrorhamnose reductase [Hydrogenophaga sp.]|uniref:dTDP-4-dehydrorhamnose reductase n=1 Tax=Hydrogenophaga sp. TaxID=1904254 RepID=UPI001D3DBC62|nr:dTDP-4-dehydrorhamnose reductase [Hydrogenophaga sp.]MBX3611653.1 dTDP-4-dehydrorhamnose reductase [Hydrogenophaga sp.]
MKILLLGAMGQVGWELQRSLAPLGEVVALDRDTAETADFSRPDTLPALVARHAPDVIVNAAAHTAVDKAESEPELAHTLNATAPGMLAQAAAGRGALLVHYSTDYVFDGSGEQARSEDAPTGPLSVYGRTKLAGEQAIRASGGRHLILRTSWVYGTRGQNFPKTMLRLAQEREVLRIVDDQVGAPTGADLLADVTAHTVRATLGDARLGGTYHVAPQGEVSWHGFARYCIDTARELRPDLRWQLQRLDAIPSTDYPTPARRPLNSRLNTARLQAAFGLALPRWEPGVRRMLAEFLTPS